MKKIKQFRMSLMKKESDLNEENKANFIVKCSGTLNVEKILENNNTDEFDFVLESAGLVYDELKNKVDAKDVDNLGIWFVFDDDTQIDNSIELSVLDDIKKYNEESEPIKEFVKMTFSR